MRTKLQNTDTTSGINARGDEGSGSVGFSQPNETVVSEAGKFEGLKFPQSQPSLVAG